MEEESKTGLKIPVWDCKPTSFAQWGKKIGRYLMSKELAWVLRHVSVGTGIAPPAGAAAVRKGNARAFAYIASSIANVDDLDMITEQYDEVQGKAAKEALLIANPHANVAAQQVAYDGAAVGFEAQRLWDALEEAAKGPVADMSGKDLHTELFSL